MLSCFLVISTVISAAVPYAAGQPAEDPLEALKQRIAAGEVPNVHSVIVIQGDKTLAEWYFSGKDEIRGVPAGQVIFDATKLHDARSMSKSVVSMLFGIAVAEGKIPDLDRPVLDYFPEYPDLRTPKRLKIRVRHILSMTSGLAWDESSRPYTDPRNSETAMDLAADRNRYVLSQKIVSAPGKRFRYSGGDVALAGAILARATKTPLEVYAQRTLFGPLGMAKADWLRDEKGIAFAASGLRLTPPDMAKIGLLVLRGGAWKGTQVVSKEWVTASTSPQAQVDPDPTCGRRYGYFWWLSPGCAHAAHWFAAIGNGGQRIWVIPSRNLVVVTTAGLYNDPKQKAAADAVLRAAMAATAPSNVDDHTRERPDALQPERRPASELPRPRR